MKPPMRPGMVAAPIALCLGFFILSPAFSAAQEQSDSQRKIVSRIVPAYPDLARKMQIKGTVRIGVVVASSGKLKSAQVIGGNPILVKAAMDTIEKWRWAPASQETKELVELNFHP